MDTTKKYVGYIVDNYLFTKENIFKLSKFMNGLFVNNSEIVSSDLKHPNQLYGLYPERYHEWNPFGNGLIFESFDFPIIELNSIQSQQLLQVQWFFFDIYLLFSIQIIIEKEIIFHQFILQNLIIQCILHNQKIQKNV